MRERVTEDTGKRSFRLLWVFLGIVFLLVFVSLSLKIFQVVRKSTFDGRHRFVVLLISNERSEVISLEPGVNVFRLVLSSKTTKKDLAAKFSLPIDGVVETEHSFSKGDHVASILLQIVLDPRTTYDSVTFFDIFRMYLSTFRLPKREILSALLTTSSTKEFPVSLKKYFVDKGIVGEKQVIAVENGAGVSGLAQKFEQTIELLGANVVSVTTARETQQPTYIFYSGKKTYTVHRLERLLHQQAEEGNTGVADILVILGRRSLTDDFFATLRT